MPESTRRRLWNTTILLPVFIPAFFFILLLVIGTASQPELAGELFSSVLSYITNTFGWFYMLSVAIFPGLHRHRRPEQVGAYQARA